MKLIPTFFGHAYGPCACGHHACPCEAEYPFWFLLFRYPEIIYDAQSFNARLTCFGEQIGSWSDDTIEGEAEVRLLERRFRVALNFGLYHK